MMEINGASTAEVDELSQLESKGRREADDQNIETGVQLEASPGTTSTSSATGRDEVIREYEAMLVRAERSARIVGFLYAACRFISYCNLTWATVVLLGGFSSDLQPPDFWRVAALLVAEAAILASATFFFMLRDHSPSNLNLNLLHPPLFLRFVLDLFLSPRLVSYIAQYGINAAVFFVVTKRMERLKTVYSHVVDTARNLHPALLLFYWLLLLNYFLHTLRISSQNYFIYRGGEYIRYYEHVLEKLLRGSLGLADPVDFFHFAYVEALGREFQHNANRNLVVRKYGKMLEYRYAHRQGLDHLYVYLEYGDASFQQAAANVPGLWMLRPTSRGMVESLPEGLVTRLLRRLPDNGEVGWAAANSLGAIAANGKGDLLLSFGTKVGDALAAAVDPRTSRSLVLVGAMVFLVHGQVYELESPPMLPSSSSNEDDPVLSKIFSIHRREQLEKDLESLMRDATVHRLRALSAYLLFLLGRDPTHIDLPDAHPFLGITPTSDKYWLSREKEMLAQLYDQFRATTGGRSGMPEFPVIDEDGELTVPAWAQAVS